MAGKQIDFPSLQKEDPRVVKIMVGASVLCIVIVAVLLLAGVEGPFIGPIG
jgi:hypothetical protein